VPVRSLEPQLGHPVLGAEGDGEIRGVRVVTEAQESAALEAEVVVLRSTAQTPEQAALAEADYVSS
jgi:hypothetical protein